MPLNNKESFVVFTLCFIFFISLVQNLAKLYKGNSIEIPYKTIMLSFFYIYR